MKNLIWMTAPEVAQELGIGLSTAYRIIERGDIPALRVPGTRTLRVKRADFERAYNAALIGVESRPKQE